MAKKILIVEDEDILLTPLTQKLTISGFEVKGARNGQEGIDILTRENFDLVLLDLLMPKLDGFAVLEQMKQKNIKVKTVLLTNLVNPENEAKAQNYDVIGYWIKTNCSLDEIITRIKNIVGE